ncbi:MbtH family NRPS accessory protein [Streptomyces sp. NPDC048196]|uniref:MbtH family protein n=1 Tax=Streptomyces sp. NPDC048196 TaxID=3154712 RepID=UPI0033C261D4
MKNPFENPNGTDLVLMNGQDQHSLWPSFIDVSDGWTVVKQEDNVPAHLKYVKKNWVDMRPTGLIKAMEERGF